MKRADLAQQEIARRRLAQERLLPFAKRFYPDYMAGWAHKVIAANLEWFLTKTINKESPRLMIFMPPQTGKLCAHDTPVLTANRGWTTHGDLRVGDYVFHPSGRKIAVVALSEDDEAHFEVEFTNGEVIQTHARHEWRVYDRRKGGSPECVVETQDMLADHWIGEKGVRGGRARWQLPDMQGVEYPHQDLPLDPYLLGVWLGDGTTGKPYLTNSQEDALVFRAAFERAGYPCTNTYIHPDYGTWGSSFYRTDLMLHLRDTGVFEKKHIPEVYLRCSREQRRQLLAGLIDSDGTTDSAGRYYFSTTSLELRDGMTDLLTGLGYRPSLSVSPPNLSSSGIQGTKDVATISFQPLEPIPVKLVRKMTTRIAMRRKIAVRNVRRVAPKPGRCIEVDSPDGMYLVGRSLIPTHNSMLTSDIFPSWAIGRYPHLRFILTSYSVSLPIRFSRYVRERVKSEAFAPLFPDTRLHPEIQAAEHWETTQGGGFRAVGVGGSITGHGAEVIVVDDPFKDFEEAYSETIRETVHNWYPTTLRTRLQPGGGIININTRWHFDDLSGWLLRKDKENREDGVPESQLENWRILNLPALAKHDEYVTTDFRVVEEPEPGSVLVRREGEPLHPERHSADEWKRRKAGATAQQWSALYQQDPVPDSGEFFKSEDFMYYDNPPPLHSYPVLFAWDLAVGQKKHNDWTVGVAGVVIPSGNTNTLKILDMFRGRVRDKELMEAIVSMYQKYQKNAYGLGIEYGQLYLSIENQLKQAFMDKNISPVLDDTLRPVTDKRVRATPLRGWMQNHKVYFPKHQPWTEKAREEMLRFDAGLHDDIVDALAWLVRMAEKLPLVPERGYEKHRGEKSVQDRIADAYRAQRLGSGSSTGYLAA